MTHRARATFLLASLALVLAELRLDPTDLLQLARGTFPAWEQVMLREFRLPRLILALMIGSGMAISGWSAQAATRNPLASPGVLSINAGAALGVMVTLWLSQGAILGSRLVPLVAAGSGTASALLLFTLVGRRRRLDGSGLLLTGIALGALLSAATFTLALNARDTTYRYALAWLYGSLDRATWDYAWLLLPAWWFLALAVHHAAPWIHVLSLDDPLVTSLGGHPNRWRRAALCLGAALGAACVGVGGNFAFVGFVAPNVVRMHDPAAARTPWRSACVGAALLLTADVVGQTALAPAEVPAGIVAAVLGAPLFVIALVRWRAGQRSP